MEATMDIYCEEIDFFDHFSYLEDPRQIGKVLYPLDGLLGKCWRG
jgi:hypothetical protein